MEFIVLRLIERILAVIVGGLSLYFGYRLLHDKPDKGRGKGKITLPGGIAIDLKRVGPGVFFALFGSIIVAFSIYSSVTFTEVTTTSSNGEVETSTTVSGVGENSVLDDDARRSRVVQDMHFLNETLSDMLSEDLSPTERAFIELDIQHLKLTLLSSIWEDNWGHFTDFESLVQSDNLAAATASMQEAVAHFLVNDG